jgi:outer membrane protein TolC
MTRRLRRCAAGVLAGAFNLLLFGSVLGDEPAKLPDAPTLADFLRVAELRSPGLESMRREWLAETGRTDHAGSFPDPQVSFAWYVQEVETRVGPQTHRASLRQRLPWFGKLGFRREAAAAGADAAAARYRDRRFALRADVTRAWYDLYWLGQAIDRTRENLELLSNLERVVRAKYRIGAAEHADLIRLQVELGVVEDRLRSLEDRVRPTEARLNALLHRPLAEPLAQPRNLPEQRTAPERDAVVEALREGAPRLGIRDHAIVQAEAKDRLARRSRWPDWSVGVDWIRTGEALNPELVDSGKDAVIVSISTELPLFRGKYEGPIREAEESLAATLESRDAEEDELIARADAILYEWRDADRRSDLYENALLPKAVQSLEATTTAYRNGKGGFLDMIDAQRILLEFELELARAWADRGRSAATLESVTGTEWGKEVSR